MAVDKVFGIFGLGTFGSKVAKTLAQRGQTVITVDNNSDKIEKIKNDVTQAILLDSTDEDALNNAPLENIDTAIIGMGDEVEASILTTALLKKYGIPHIIARATSDIHEKVLKQVGASEVINIEIDEALRLSHQLTNPDLIDTMDLGENQQIVSITVPDSFVNSTLEELDLRNKYNLNVISIKRAETKIDEMGNPTTEHDTILPEPSTKLRANDIIVMAGSAESIDKIRGK